MSKEQNDHNLLYGMLALQVDLVTQDQLIAAMQTWVSNKRQPLGEILLSQQAINDGQKSAIDSLVDAHVVAHGGIEHSLKAAAQGKDVVGSLERVGDDAVSESLGHARTLSTARSAEQSVDADEDSRTLTLVGTGNKSADQGRFRILRLHDEGGLGRVYEAHDEELDRTVALKEIKERFADDTNSRQRFVLEAEVTGGLEHPGIVPVYGLGRYKDGRPFYAMRFIRGGSLRQAIRDFHEKDWSQEKPGARTLELRRLLRRFIDVCNAVSYAHRRGVLHRDLKPGNVMLGKYGETLVVDWGLAKTLGDDLEEAVRDSIGDLAEPENVLFPRSGSSIDATQLGNAIGSPSYMSPEQARGEHNRLGVGTDIYSLGGILFSILTNKRPVEGETQQEILQRVREGKIPKPTSVAPNVPKPLESVVMKSLSAEPSGRYATAEEVIRDVERYLGNEPVSAHRESISERLSRLGRRHRTLVRTAAVAVLAIAGIATFFALSLNEQQKQTQREKLRGDRVLEHVVSVLRRPDPEQDGRKVMLADILDRAVEDTKSALDEEPLTKASILQAIGETYLGLGLYQEGGETMDHALRIRQSELGPTHQDTLWSRQAIANTMIGQLQFEDAIPVFQEIHDSQTALLGKNHKHTIASLHGLATAYSWTNRTDEAIATYSESLRLLQARASKATRLEGNATDDGAPSAQSIDAKQRNELIIEAMSGLCLAHDKSGDGQSAAKKAEEAVAYALETFGESHRSTLSAMHLQARMLFKNANGDESKYQEAVPIFKSILESRREQLGASHGDTVSTINDLAMCYYKLGQIEDAIEQLEEAYEIRYGTYGDRHILTRTSLYNLANVNSVGERHAEAADAYQQIVDSFSEKEQVDPNNSGLYYALANSHVLAGEYAKAQKVYSRLNAGNLGDKSKNLQGLVHCLLAQRNFPAARAAIENWLEVAPAGRKAEAHLGLAECRLAAGKVDEAKASLDKAQSILEDLPKERDSAFVPYLSGAIAAEQGDQDEAHRLFLAGYTAMTNLASPPPRINYRLPQAIQRIERFYEEWQQSEKTDEWRALRQTQED